MTFVQLAWCRQEEGLWLTITIRAPPDGDCRHYIFGRWINTCIYWTAGVSSACLFSPVALSWGTGSNTANIGRIEPSRKKYARYRRQWYPLLQAKMHQLEENVNDISHNLCFLLQNSSSPNAVTHKRWEVWIWFIHRTAWLSTHWFLWYIREQRCCHVYDKFPASSYVTYGWDAICNKIFYTNDCLSDNERSPWCTFSLEGCLLR